MYRHPGKTVCLVHPYVWDFQAYFTLHETEAALKTNRDKVLGYAGGYGTVLFFADTAVVDGIVKKMPK